MTKQLTIAGEEVDTTNEYLKIIQLLTNNERGLQRVLQIVEKFHPTEQDIDFIGMHFPIYSSDIKDFL